MNYTIFNKFFFLLVLVLSFNNALSQEIPSKHIDNFFETFQSVSANQAFDNLFEMNNYIAKEDVNSIKAKVNQYINLLGKYHGFDLLIKKSIGESIEVHSYLLKYERQPIRFIFTFYKPKSDWNIQNFRLSDDFIEEIENATIKLSYEDKL